MGLRGRSAVAAAVVFLTSLTGLAPAGAVSATSDDYVILVEVLDRLEIDYGNRVDESDTRSLAARLGFDPGGVLDVGDVEWIRHLAGDLAALDRLEPTFAALGMGFGSMVDPTDAHNLARRLGVGVGQVVDRLDVDRLIAAGQAWVDHPPFARWRDVVLREPSPHVEVIGFHQSNHEGARDLEVLPTASRNVLLESRGRLSGLRSAADVAIPVDHEIRSPITGTVLRSGTYELYCRYSDDFVVIQPDGLPGFELKILHISGVRVRKGDRVVAAQTVLAPSPTPLPFHSQINDYTALPRQPHVHIELIDTSIPNISNPNSGGC